MWSRQHHWMQQVWESLKGNISQACMYGSKMDKWTTIKATAALYDATCKECDNSLVHESGSLQWGRMGQNSLQRLRLNTPLSCAERWLTALQDIWSARGRNLRAPIFLNRRHWHLDNCVTMDGSNFLRCWPGIGWFVIQSLHSSFHFTNSQSNFHLLVKKGA